MIGRTNAGGGGVGGVELVIVGGTTRPAKANQNTIWIDTDKEITGYVLSATEPGNPVEGMAWITIGASGAVKVASLFDDDWITLYPLSAKQYVGGTWESVKAKSYQNGEWVEFWSTTFIIKAGVIGEYGFMTSPDYTYPAKITQKDGYIYAEGGKSGYGGMVISEMPLNLSGGKTVIADIDVVQQTNSADDYCPALFVSTVNPAANPDILAIARTKTTGRQTLTLDVSSIDADCYIGIRMGGYGSSPVPKINIYDIYVE